MGKCKCARHGSVKEHSLANQLKRILIFWQSDNGFANIVIASDCIPVPQSNLNFNLPNSNNAGLISRLSVHSKLCATAKKPLVAQFTFSLEPDPEATKLTWLIASNDGGIVQMAEPLLIKQTNAMIRKSLTDLRPYLQVKISMELAAKKIG